MNWPPSTEMPSGREFSEGCGRWLNSGVKKMATLPPLKISCAPTSPEIRPTLDTIFDRLEHMLEQLGGHMHEINREFRQQLDLDLGPLLPLDEIIGGYDPSAHVAG